MNKNAKKLIKVFNAWIRDRDKNKPCISCEIRRVTDAGHYWPTSLCPQPSMRFNEHNVHGQCAYCNRFQEGARQGYREGIIKRYGQWMLDGLDITRSLKQNPWTDFEYKTMIKKYESR